LFLGPDQNLFYWSLLHLQTAPLIVWFVPVLIFKEKFSLIRFVVCSSTVLQMWLKDLQMWIQSVALKCKHRGNVVLQLEFILCKSDCWCMDLTLVMDLCSG
jgi:hypothetical protein